jgi:hypothetical protein
MTLVIDFHQEGYRTFKDDWTWPKPLDKKHRDIEFCQEDQEWRVKQGNETIALNLR